MVTTLYDFESGDLMGLSHWWSGYPDKTIASIDVVALSIVTGVYGGRFWTSLPANAAYALIPLEAPSDFVEIELDVVPEYLPGALWENVSFLRVLDETSHVLVKAGLVFLEDGLHWQIRDYVGALNYNSEVALIDINTSYHIKLYVDKPTGTIELYVDGGLVISVSGLNLDVGGGVLDHLHVGNLWSSAVPSGSLIIDQIYVTSVDPPPLPVVETQITINAPPFVVERAVFDISGKLSEVVSGVGLPGELIVVNVDGVFVGESSTDIVGNYVLSTSIEAVGIHTITVTYSGGYGSLSIEVGETLPLPPRLPVWLVPAGLVVVGAAIILGSKKRG